jgi:hypothetical protein
MKDPGTSGFSSETPRKMLCQHIINIQPLRSNSCGNVNGIEHDIRDERDCRLQGRMGKIVSSDSLLVAMVLTKV